MLGSGGCSGRTPVFAHISFDGAANERPQFTPLEPDTPAPRLLRVLLCRLLGIAESDELQAVANAGIDTRSQIHLVYDLRLISDI